MLQSPSANNLQTHLVVLIKSQKKCEEDSGGATRRILGWLNDVKKKNRTIGAYSTAQ